MFAILNLLSSFKWWQEHYLFFSDNFQVFWRVLKISNSRMIWRKNHWLYCAGNIKALCWLSVFTSSLHIFFFFLSNDALFAIRRWKLISFSILLLFVFSCNWFSDQNLRIHVKDRWRWHILSLSQNMEVKWLLNTACIYVIDYYK